MSVSEYLLLDEGLTKEFRKPRSGFWYGGAVTKFLSLYQEA